MKLTHTLLLLFSISFAFSQHSTKLIISVNNIDIDTLVLAKSYEDLRYNGKEIPVAAGKVVEYNLEHEHIEEYALVYKSELQNGMWRPIVFFPNSTQITFDLFPSMEYDSNIVTGDDLVKEKMKYKASFNKQFMEVGNEIYTSFIESEENTDQRKKAKLRLDSLNRAALNYHYEYFKNDKSILGLNEYVELLQNAEEMMMTSELFEKYHESQIRRQDDHPLIERANNLYTALSSIKVGKEYVNVNLKTLDDKLVDLSQLIGDKKYTLLDLWTPWCAPCIRKSKILKEEHSHLKNSVKVVGVVGGIDDKASALKALDKHTYPWNNM